MSVVIRYKPNHREFGELMLSQQTQDLADEAAGAGVLVATQFAQSDGLPAEYIASIRAEPGPIIVMGSPPNPRRTARVLASFPWLEFGSGRGSRSGQIGKRNTRKRPQGGYSRPYRVLGRTGARIGKKPTRGGS